MRDFYERFYAVAAVNPAHAEFCTRVFGRNLCPHGFADMAQINALIDATGLGPGDRALDLGCGSGMIAEHISDAAGAHLSGLDYVPAAIRQARARTAAKAQRLAFLVGDINALALPDSAFDVVCTIDTMHFSLEYTLTIAQLRRTVRAGGQMAFLFSHGHEPWVPLDEFPAESVLPDRTPLVVALQANGIRDAIERGLHRRYLYHVPIP